MGCLALIGSHLSLPSGYVMGLIGENGAGKSTMLKALLGLINEDVGTIHIFGKDLKNCGQEIREPIGAVLGEVNLPDFFCGKEINRMMSGVYKNWDQEAFYGYLDSFHIDRKKAIKEYSRGMKVKAALAISYLLRFIAKKIFNLYQKRQELSVKESFCLFYHSQVGSEKNITHGPTHKNHAFASGLICLGLIKLFGNRV